MAVQGAQVSIGTTATALNVGAGDAMGLRVKNKATAAASVFLGDATVTTSGGTAGYELEPGEAVNVDASVLSGGSEVLYGVVASGSVTVHVLRVGVGS